ncbi:MULTISPECIES: monovalent cation/H(+) antiporter subunit G [Paracoccus]|jgi:multicomponent Na+:H+ antiporter subunit G|uniref:Monovalent cation/H(+) antiporter subunit G n=1 Tax=Paracoccus aerius TaxID=1915382 RepID=A0ABS1S7Q4_9RHOB|nr:MULTISPECIES: monovalent cation/H(+) antiporter subunit G [Paracoccus]MBL3674762.1 monovalent cation/H(+) antiporter subunit G [Paracoccus aerius]QIR84657.1 monovalent cation/H(+) antiporter subunit G [Paracoccus sp. AK26]GHG28527.1 hypothetical protein GCM10017322_28830 [Paracoccus aerius]
MTEILTAILALLAGGFALVAAIGILRFPDALTRMHASSKVGSLAGSLALLAAAVDIGGVSAASRALIAILFLLMTAPIGAHLLGRAAAWRSGQKPDLLIRPSDRGKPGP